MHTYIHPSTEVVYQNLESKIALFYIFDSTGSVFENNEKPIGYHYIFFRQINLQ